MTTIYFDNNASSPLDDAVMNKIQPFFQELYGNANSPHHMGKNTHESLDEASQYLYQAFNADDLDNIIITSGATESINTLHKSFLFEFLKNPSKNTVITSPWEHPASAKSLAFMEEFGMKILYIEADGLSLSLESFKEIFDPSTCALVSLSYVSHETGVIFPIQEIAELCQLNNVPIHVDATQALGKIKIDVQKTPITFASFSGHKFHAPKGVGGLYIRHPHVIHPLLHGGKHMGGFRSGTLNTGGIVGLGEALRVSEENLIQNTQYIQDLRKVLEDFLLTIPKCTVHGYDLPRNPQTTFFSIEGTDPDYIVWYFNSKGICISTGSACSTVIYNKESAPSTKGVRVSLSRLNTLNEVNIFIQTLKEIL